MIKSASDVLINKIKKVLESDLTPYRIAKEVGLSNATPVHKYIDERADILNMSLSVASRFEKLYEELFDMIRVKRTKVLTDSTLNFFALPQFKNEFQKHFDPSEIREMIMIIDEGFYKKLLIHPIIIREWKVSGYVEGALEGITPYKINYISTLDNIHENEVVNVIKNSETADYTILKQLKEPYRSY